MGTHIDVAAAMAQGFVSVPGVISEDELAELRDDARSQAVSMSSKSRDGWSVVDGWQVLGPARYSYSADGEVRDAVHERFAPRLSQVVGTELEPVQSNYLYYDQGDFIGLHLDQARCQYTVIVALDGDPEPVCVHPELAGLDPARIQRRWNENGPCGGVPVALQGGPLLINGVTIPHHRHPHPSAHRLTLATFCFRSS